MTHAPGQAVSVRRTVAPAASTAEPLPPFGAMADVMKDHCYLLERGHVYTSPWVAVDVSVPFYATISLSVRGAHFALRVQGRELSCQAVAIRPPTRRAVRALDVEFVSFAINPLHPCFRHFRAIPPPGVMSLPRGLFAPLDDALGAAYRGELTLAEATDLLEHVVALVVRQLPPPKPPDPRVVRAIERLQRDPQYPLERMAEAVGVSYDRMSHLFIETVGLPLRSYLLWRKIYNVAPLLGSGRSLTEIAHAAGFCDSSHMCRIYQQVFGASPSYFLRSDCIQVFSAWQSNHYHR